MMTEHWNHLLIVRWGNPPPIGRRLLMKRVPYMLVTILLMAVLVVIAGCGGEGTSKSQETLDLTGTWSGDWWRSDGDEEGTLTVALIQSGGSLSGDMTVTSTTFSYSRDTTVSGTVEGSDVVFGIAIGGNGAIVTIDYEGTVSEDGDQMSGTYSMSTGYTGTWDVTRE